jgi:hypothetical protein
MRVVKNNPLINFRYIVTATEILTKEYMPITII